MPDLTITLPEPIVIPAIDRRRKTATPHRTRGHRVHSDGLCVFSWDGWHFYANAP
jgi:hypothetical protein